MWTALILLLLIMITVPAQTYALSPSEAVDNVVNRLVDMIMGALRKIVDAVTNAIKGFIDSVAGGLRRFASAVFDTLLRPFDILADSIRDSYAWLQDRLGPAAPLGLAVIVGGVALILWRVVKIMIPGPIP